MCRSQNTCQNFFLSFFLLPRRAGPVQRSSTRPSCARASCAARSSAMPCVAQLCAKASGKYLAWLDNAVEQVLSHCPVNWIASEEPRKHGSAPTYFTTVITSWNAYFRDCMGLFRKWDTILKVIRKQVKCVWTFASWDYNHGVLSLDPVKYFQSNFWSLWPWSTQPRMGPSKFRIEILAGRKSLIHVRISARPSLSTFHNQDKDK